jgi:DNA-binding NarL/FixJ family response regulator
MRSESDVFAVQESTLGVIRVLVADNNLIHTELLGQAIGKDRHISVVGLSTSAWELRKGIQQASPDVVLVSDTLDQCLRAGLEVISEMRSTHPLINAVALMDSPSRATVVDAFRAGARGVFCRNQPIKMLCKCIFAVSQGQVWANSSELGFVLEALTRSPFIDPFNTQSLGVLSDRERAVINCLGEGLANREIAERLNISHHTVKNYMFRIFEKLGVCSRLELLLFVLSRKENDRAGTNDLPGSTMAPVAQPCPIVELRGQAVAAAGTKRFELKQTSLKSRESVPVMAARAGPR